MDDAIAIALKCQTKGVFLLGIDSSLRMRTLECIGCKHRLFTSLQILTPEHASNPHQITIAPAIAAFQESDGNPTQALATAADGRFSLFRTLLRRILGSLSEGVNGSGTGRLALTWQAARGCARLYAAGIMARVYINRGIK